mmetsp:Transcript_30571/g.72113  ORF Transcript_30571/g.72113 Transcript_30571/m.72113 type:complete len:212 (+) Transcript_30571:108-743(+)
MIPRTTECTVPDNSRKLTEETQITCTSRMEHEGMSAMKSAPSTPTGTRASAIVCNRNVLTPPRRDLLLPSDANSCSTPERWIGASRSISLSSSLTDSSSTHTQNVSLYDLIDEEFVVNSGAFSGDRCGVDERIIRRNGNNNACSSRPQHRRRKSILDMIDRIGSTADDDDSSVMTTRSYPRGVYVVPPTGRETTSTGNVVAFVSSEAYNQW